MDRTHLIATLLGGVLPASTIAVIAAAGIWLGGSASSAFALDGLPEQTVHNYHFVESQPALAARIPCYCGCYSFGHTNLLDCYIRPEGGYEQHASGCGICGMEADDIEQMLADGRAADSIRAAIDAEYGSYGKPTNTP